MALSFEIRLYQNPWPNTVPQLKEILSNAAVNRAASIEIGFSTGEYRWERLAFAVLDPTAPISRSTDDAILAIICIGEEGPQFAVNALAKACEHRDHGAEAGVLAFTQKHRLSDEDNRRGFSAEVSGTIIGSSGLISHQDLYEATMLAAEINYEVSRARAEWEEAQGRGGWFNVQGEASERYRAMWERTAAETAHG